MASMKKFIEVTVDDLQIGSGLKTVADSRNSVVDIVEIRFKGLEDAQQPNRRLVLSKRRGQLKQISGRHRLPVLPEVCLSWGILKCAITVVVFSFATWNAIVAFEMLLDLINFFGPVIHSTLSVSSLVGVELQAEQRCHAVDNKEIIKAERR
ncbi:uncharacterized protein [Aegilops tauschii subsp. strangulata]|uniref:uncharacterized protein n=1 Tax=Aegilops tauschii subsp. strangulata TaxID=200361 RepID=UPI003CC894A4